MSESENPAPHAPEKITIEGPADPYSHETLVTLVGKVTWVMINDAVIKAEGTPYGDLFRFARITAVTRRAEDDLICANCKQEARSAIEIVWEVEYSNPNHIMCEECINGIVTGGLGEIVFPA
jgi:hypothetical protein